MPPARENGGNDRGFVLADAVISLFLAAAMLLFTVSFARPAMRTARNVRDAIPGIIAGREAFFREHSMIPLPETHEN